MDVPSTDFSTMADASSSEGAHITLIAQVMVNADEDLKDSLYLSRTSNIRSFAPQSPIAP